MTWPRATRTSLGEHRGLFPIEPLSGLIPIELGPIAGEFRSAALGIARGARIGPMAVHIVSRL